MKSWIVAGALAVAGWCGAALADDPVQAARAPDPTSGATARQGTSSTPDVPAAFQSASELPSIEREPSPHAGQAAGPRDIRSSNPTAAAPSPAETPAQTRPPELNAPQGVGGSGVERPMPGDVSSTAPVGPPLREPAQGEPPPVETPSPLLNAPDFGPPQEGTGGSGVEEPSSLQTQPAYPQDTPGLPRSTTRAADSPTQVHVPPPGAGVQAPVPSQPLGTEPPVQVSPPRTQRTEGTEHLGTLMSGVTMMANGGVEGYLGPVSNLVRPGVSWGVTLGGRPSRVLGVEVGYSGGANEVNAGGGDLAVGPDVVRTGATAVAMVGPPWRVQPYLLGGVGLNIYAVHGFAAGVGMQSDLAAAVPVGAGVHTQIGRFNADARVDYNLGFGESFAGQLSGIGNAGRYQGVLQLGGTF